ncbi:amino-acid N-acetyltransferase [Salinisphaera orenii]|uniref:amino-acid N-acetyltransferase n=1 Tax=Salinisphaera orenii TaxID=856731 RepID=UPI000DBE82D3
MNAPAPRNSATSDNVSPAEAAAAALRTSAPYIRAHRGRTFVVHLPGEAADDDALTTLVEDLALLSSLGVRLLLVLGARPQIDYALATAGVETPFVNATRVTSATALTEVVKAVGAHMINIEARLSRSVTQTTLGGTGVATARGNFVVAKPLGIVDGVDHEHTGEVRRIDTDGINAALDGGQIVMVSALGYSPSGEIFNVLTEDLATLAAIELGADKLVMLHDGAALTERAPNVGRQLPTANAESLAKSEHDASIRTLLAHAAHACRGGVARTHLVAFTDTDALLRELYSRDGAGTLVTAGGYDTIRTATPDDLTGILALIEPLAAAGVLVSRSREAIERDLAYYRVMARDGLITACAALVPYPDARATELACVAVHPDYRGQSRAAELLARAEKETRESGFKQLFALTTRTPHWFIEHGFEKAGRDDLPAGRQALYNDQRNSAVLVKPVATDTR